MRIDTNEEKPLRLWAYFGLLAILVFIVSIRIQAYFDFYQFNEEVRILYHLDPSKLQRNDYSGQFLSQFPQPIAYEALTKTALATGTNLEVFHRALGASCFIAFLVGLFVASLRVGSLFALIVASFAATQIVFFQQTSSAAPHALAFPLLSWMLVALMHDRPWLGGVLTILASLLYIPMAPLLGLMFAGHALLLRSPRSKSAKQLAKTAAVVAFVGLISVGLVSEHIQPIDGYGTPIEPGQDIEKYPENGPKGRYHVSVFSPVHHVVSTALGQFHKGVPPVFAFLFLALILVFSALGLYHLRSAPAAFRAFSVFLITSALCFGIVFALRPYVSYRFALYPLFTALPFLFIYGLGNTWSSMEKRAKPIQLGVVLMVLAIGVSLGTASNNQTSRPLSISTGDREMLEFLKTLPSGSLIAAWPNRDAASLIPYLTGQPLLVDYKAHYPSYEQHILEMRERMLAMVDAYFAKSIEPLQSLKCRWGVDYILVENSTLRRRGEQLTYFAPFGQRISELRELNFGQQAILLQVPDKSAVFTSEQYVVFDLGAISDTSKCEF